MKYIREINLQTIRIIRGKRRRFVQVAIFGYLLAIRPFSAVRRLISRGERVNSLSGAHTL